MILSTLLILFFTYITPYCLAQEISPGLFYERFNMPASNTTMHFLTIDPQLNDLSLVNPRGGDLTSTIVQQHGVAGINGAFFKYPGESSGSCKIDNAWYSIRETPQILFGWGRKSHEFITATGSIQNSLEINGQRFPIASFNFQKNNDDGEPVPTIYTKEFGTHTPKAPHTYEIIVANNHVISTPLTGEAGGNTAIPSDGFIYSFSGDNQGIATLADSVDVEAFANFQINVLSDHISPDIWNSMDFILGGSEIDTSLTTEVSAQAAIGITPNNFIKLIMVENNPGISTSELRKLMIDLNCIAFFSISDGKSSTMAIPGATFFPKSRKVQEGAFRAPEARVPNALVVKPKKDQ